MVGGTDEAGVAQSPFAAFGCCVDLVFISEVGEELGFVFGVDEGAGRDFEDEVFGAGAVHVFALAVGTFFGFVEFFAGEGAEGVEMGVDFEDD